MPDASLRKHIGLRLRTPSQIFPGPRSAATIKLRYRGFESGERFIRLPPSISAFSPSAAPLVEATRRLAGYAHNYPGLRRFAVLALEYTSMERSERSTSARDTLLAYRHSLAVAV
jgi:hypothetical protein